MNPKFKLLITTDTSGDVWSYTYALCESLIKNMNIEILVISTGGKPSPFQTNHEELPSCKVIYTDYLLRQRSDFDEYYKQSASFEKYLSQTIEEFSPHLVHLNHYVAPAVKTGTPVIMTVHNDIIARLKSNDYRKNSKHHYPKYRSFIEHVTDKPLVIVTTSRFMAEEFVRTYNFKNYIKIIYTGINYEPQAFKPDEMRLITTTGALTEYSGRSDNIGLIHKIATKMPDNIKFYIIGKHKNELKKLSDIQKPSNIQFIDNVPQSELRELYKQSSIFLALSSQDIYSISPIEAAYSNCAIIANDIPVFNEMWGDCACIFAKDDVNSLIRNINNLVENNNLLALTAKNCQAKALATYNSKKMGLEYINLYKNIMKANTLRKC